MNKRSAVLIAAGLVLTLGIGGLAVSLGLTGPAAGAADLAEPQQVVEVSRRTVTTPQPTSGNAAPASEASDGSGDHEDEDEHEDEHESEDHEMDDSEDEG